MSNDTIPVGNPLFVFNKPQMKHSSSGSDLAGQRPARFLPPKTTANENRVSPNSTRADHATGTLHRVIRTHRRKPVNARPKTS